MGSVLGANLSEGEVARALSTADIRSNKDFKSITHGSEATVICTHDLSLRYVGTTSRQGLMTIKKSRFSDIGPALCISYLKGQQELRNAPLHAPCLTLGFNDNASSPISPFSAPTRAICACNCHLVSGWFKCAVIGNSRAFSTHFPMAMHQGRSPCRPLGTTQSAHAFLVH
jgi:hypothetical protein